MRSEECSFCCSEEARWVYGVDRPLVSMEPVSGRTIQCPEGAWKACHDCAVLIDADQYQRLAHVATVAWMRGCEDQTCDAEVKGKVGVYYSVLLADFAEARRSRQPIRKPITPGSQVQGSVS